MSKYPVRQDIRSNDNDPSIIPTQFIAHVAVVPIFNGISSGPAFHDHLDWQFYIDAGPGKPEEIITQLRDTHVQADANFLANGPRADGTGAISFESEGDGNNEWTEWQVDAIVWLFKKGNEIDGIPLVLCPAWDAPGLGYHRLFNEWNKPYHSCPGDAKVAQFRNIILPRVQETSVLQSQSLEDNMPAVIQYGNDLDAFYVDLKGNLVQRWYSPGSGGDDWNVYIIGSGCTPGAVPVIIRDYLGVKGRLDVFVEAGDKGLAHGWYVAPNWGFEFKSN